MLRSASGYVHSLTWGIRKTRSQCPSANRRGGFWPKIVHPCGRTGLSTRAAKEALPNGASLKGEKSRVATQELLDWGESPFIAVVRLLSPEVCKTCARSDLGRASVRRRRGIARPLHLQLRVELFLPRLGAHPCFAQIASASRAVFSEICSAGVGSTQFARTDIMFSPGKVAKAIPACWGDQTCGLAATACVDDAVWHDAMVVAHTMASADPLTLHRSLAWCGPFGPMVHPDHMACADPMACPKLAPTSWRLRAVLLATSPCAAGRACPEPALIPWRAPTPLARPEDLALAVLVACPGRMACTDRKVCVVHWLDPTLWLAPIGCTTPMANAARYGL